MNFFVLPEVLVLRAKTAKNGLNNFTIKGGGGNH